MSEKVTATGRELSLTHHDTEDARQVRHLLAAVYREVYAGDTDPFYSVARFEERFDGHSAAPGWECVLARYQGEVIGFAYGYPLPPNARWWTALRTPVDPALIEETGARTFAFCEGMALPAWRKSGAAKLVHDTLLAARPEERATLLVHPGRPRLRAHYESWGYRKIGEIHPFPDASVYDSLVLVKDEAS